MGRKQDPRIDLIVRIMQQTRVERIKRFVSIGDMRRRGGRVLLAEEAKSIIEALDAHSRAALQEPSHAE